MAGKISKNVSRLVSLVVIAAIVGVGVYFFVASGDDQKVTARFSSAVGIYEGTPVRQLGVNVGEVSKVTPKGSYVEVQMTYDSEYSLPSNATAVEVANSLVSDRFIQLSAYKGSGAKLANSATIPESRTGGPAEIDDIYKALNTLSTALGPNGANKNGALSTLLSVGAANLKGNGQALGQSIANLSQAATTLANGRTDLFGTVTNLRNFTGALKQSDTQVRSFNTLLAKVADNLASERGDLGEALKQLGIALGDVNTFVKQNASRIHTSVTGLKQVTNTLVGQKASLEETLSLAPVALANIVHSYQPNLGVLATRSNLASLFDPGQLCTVIDALGTALVKNPLGLEQLLGPLKDQLVSTCKTAVQQSPSLTSRMAQPDVSDLVNSLISALPKNQMGAPFVGGGAK